MNIKQAAEQLGGLTTTLRADLAEMEQLAKDLPAAEMAAEQATDDEARAKKEVDQAEEGLEAEALNKDFGEGAKTTADERKERRKQWVADAVRQSSQVAAFRDLHRMQVAGRMAAHAKARGMRLRWAFLMRRCEARTAGIVFIGAALWIPQPEETA